MARIQGYPKFRALLADGSPAVAYKLYSYLAGTSTPEPTYADQTQATENANPTILDGNGEAQIWLKPDTAYKLVLKTDADVEVWTVDAIGTPEGGFFSTLTVTGPATFAAPVSMAGQLTSTVSHGTPPMVLSSATVIPNLNASFLEGGSWGSIPGNGELVDLIPAPSSITGQAVRLQSVRGTSGFNIPGTDITLRPASGTGSGKGGDIILEPGNSPTGTQGKEIFNAPDANGGQWIRGLNSEEVTLNTGAATTDSVANLLPANAIIEAVTYLITETITTAANFTVGDSAQAARFLGTQSTLTAGTTGIGLLQHNVANGSNDLGPVQSAAAKVRITCNAAPGAGKLRINVWYQQFVAPTS